MNFRKTDVRSLSLMLLAFSMIMGTALQNDAFAQEMGMSINVNADEGSKTLSVSGKTTSLLNDVTIMVVAPNGNIVSVDQVSPNLDGEYMTDIKIGSLWKQDGVYKVAAQQGTSSLRQVSVQVSISGGAAMATSVSESSMEKNPFMKSDPTDTKQGLTIVADAIEGSKTIGISGHTDRLNTDITIKVTAPNGNVISVDQITPDLNGNYDTDIQVGAALWSQDGFYTITAQQGQNTFYKASVKVDIKDGAVIPEFGTIAALVLAVAIVSIIAVTARSKLSVIPRY